MKGKTRSKQTQYWRYEYWCHLTCFNPFLAFLQVQQVLLTPQQMQTIRKRWRPMMPRITYHKNLPWCCLAWIEGFLKLFKCEWVAYWGLPGLRIQISSILPPSCSSQPPHLVSLSKEPPESTSAPWGQCPCGNASERRISYSSTWKHSVKINLQKASFSCSAVAVSASRECRSL